MHSYLTYLRDRLTGMRDLLTESGSIFVQIGDDNVHRVRDAVMDEVFGEENFVSCLISVQKNIGHFLRTMFWTIFGRFYSVGIARDFNRMSNFDPCMRIKATSLGGNVNIQTLMIFLILNFSRWPRTT